MCAGRTEKVSLIGQQTKVASYWFWDENRSGLPRTAHSIYADRGTNVLQLEQDMKNFQIIFKK